MIFPVAALSRLPSLGLLEQQAHHVVAVGRPQVVLQASIAAFLSRVRRLIRGLCSAVLTEADPVYLSPRPHGPSFYPQLLFPLVVPMPGLIECRL